MATVVVEFIIGNSLQFKRSLEKLRITLKTLLFLWGQNITTYENRKKTLLLSHLCIISRTISRERELYLKRENEESRNIRDLTSIALVSTMKPFRI